MKIYSLSFCTAGTFSWIGEIAFGRLKNNRGFLPWLSNYYQSYHTSKKIIEMEKMLGWKCTEVSLMIPRHFAWRHSCWLRKGESRPSHGFAALKMKKFKSRYLKQLEVADDIKCEGTVCILCIYLEGAEGEHQLSFWEVLHAHGVHACGLEAPPLCWVKWEAGVQV